jgi:exopolysaccharide biosynthesis polyprenyl glycosylphosphotransferase
MYRRHGQKLGLVFLACDLAVTAGAWYAAYLLRFTLWPSKFGVPDPALVAAALPLVLMLAAVSYRLCGLYEVHRLRELPRELGVVGKASGLLFVLSITVVFYRRDLYESRLALALFLAINAVGLAAGRRIVWLVLKRLRSRGLQSGRAVIVGGGRTGRLAAETILQNSWTGLEAVGYVDAPGKAVVPRLPRLGGIEELGQVVAAHRVDHVFVALPLWRYGELPAVYRALDELLVEVQLVPDLPHLAGMRIRTLEIDEVAFLSLRGNPQHGWRRAIKRLMDVALAGLALVLLAPVLLTLAALVKWSSRGPVLYRQPRAGLGGRDFEMLKFRSMRIDAEHKSGPVWATRHDDRCTPLGRFMRRWSLDELPQLINVLKGEMSLVGPRPERGVFVERFRRQIPSYAQRHQVKAGITGWAQVNGWRGNTSLRRRLECDLYYISNWSLLLDCKILFMTLWCGLRNRNAY